jgi:hypothetical protein
VPFRIALLGAVSLGLVARFAFLVACPLAEAVDPEPRRHTPWALLGAWMASLGPAVLRQGSRVEVYALAAALAVWVLRLASAERLSPAVRARGAVLAVALGLANHHFIALTVAPLALEPCYLALKPLDAPGRRRTVASWGLLALLGIVPYALLPLRSDAWAGMVRIRTISDFLWTVSAKTFQKNVGTGVPGLPGDRALDVLEWIGAGVSPVGLLFFLGALFLGARGVLGEVGRRAALRCFGVAVLVGGARALLGFVRGNPDAAGYLVPAVAAVGSLAAVFPAVIRRALQLARPHPAGPTPAARWALTLLLVWGPWLVPPYLLWRSWQATAQDRFPAADALGEAQLGPLPPRAMVLAYAPETVFRLRYLANVEGERPDVTVLEVPFFGYPGMTDRLRRQDEVVLDLLRDYLARGAPRVEDLAGLAARRPLWVELDPRDLLVVLPLVVPRGPLAEVRAEPTTMASVRGAGTAHFVALDALDALFRRGPAEHPKAQEALLWRHYNDALFYAARGARPEGRASVRRALALAPESRELAALAAALAGEAEAGVDVRPFLVGGGR